MASLTQENTVARRVERNSGVHTLLGLLKDPYEGLIGTDAVSAGLITSISFTILLAIGFSLLRPYNSVVYAPKLKVADERHAPPPMGKGLFAWIGPLIKTKEQDLVQLIGMDAIVFLRFQRMCRNIFVVIALLGCAILLPVNLVNGKESKGFLKVTPLNTFGRSNWAMVIFAYLVNVVMVGFLWINYRAILKLRRQYYDGMEYKQSLHARTLMLNDIPPDRRSNEGIAMLIDEVAHSSSFSLTAIARNVKDLPDLIEEHEEAVRELEKHLAKYLKDPDNLPSERPQCKPSKKDPSWRTYPKGAKVDAIEYLTRRITELEILIKEIRASVDHRNPLPYGFATFEAITEAHIIAYAARKKTIKGTIIRMAPRPNDIIWKNMALSKSQRRTRRMLNTLWVGLLTIIYVAPNAMISIFLVSLSNLGHVWPAFQRSLERHTTWWAVVQGVASPAITSLVYLILPTIFRRLAVRAGDRTKTVRERHVTGKLYTFFVFNFLVVFSVFSTLWSFVSTIISNTSNGEDAWKAIQDADFGLGLYISLCGISPFWVAWLLQRNLGAAIDLAQLWTLTWTFCVRKFSSPTPREMIELTAPPAFDYASYYNYFLFYSTVALSYAVFQPLALPAAALYFVLDVYLKKYLLLYIFITKTESGGMFWRMLFNRMIFATILSNVVVFLGVWVHGDNSHMEAYVVIPLPFFMIAFKLYCKKAFDDKIRYYAIHAFDSEASQGQISGNKSDKLSKKFGHPALYKPLITPMVHARAQNKLASVYAGRLSDSHAFGSDDVNSVSAYSDTFALDPMLPGKPGRTAKGLPNFEMVPENKLDFAFYKSRAEFREEYGGNGGIYGKAEDFDRPDTPASSAWGGSDFSRPGTPRTATPHFDRIRSPTIPFTQDGVGDIGYAHRSQFYSEPNDSNSALVPNAAEMPGSPGYHGGDIDYRPPGFLGGGPQGYGGLPQQEEDDARSYSHFRQPKIGSNSSTPRF